MTIFLFFEKKIDAIHSIRPKAKIACEVNWWHKYHASVNDSIDGIEQVIENRLDSKGFLSDIDLISNGIFFLLVVSFYLTKVFCYFLRQYFIEGCRFQ
jgi:hypothetical protein